MKCYFCKPLLHLDLTEFIVVRLNKSGLPICFEPAVVGKVLITGICNDFLILLSVFPLHIAEKRDECAKIYPVAKHANARYKSAVDCKLDIVSGLYLAVVHIIVFHVHERCIRVSLGITVSLFTRRLIFSSRTRSSDGAVLRSNPVSGQSPVVGACAATLCCPAYRIYPRLLAQKTQKVRVRALKKVVVTQTLPVRVPSWPICLAMT